MSVLRYVSFFPPVSLGVALLLLASCKGVDIRSQSKSSAGSSPLSSPTPASSIDAKVVGGVGYSALLYQGQLYYWGYLNMMGSAVATPTLVSSLGSTVTDVAAGNDTICAVSNGALYCWGENGDYQLGQGTGNWTDSTTPLLVQANQVSKVAVGRYHGCFVRTNSALHCWGSNYYGQFGNGTYTDNRQVNGSPEINTGVLDVVAGEYHTCALMNDGSVRCAGYNNTGIVGTNASTGNITTWTTVSLPATATQLVSGGQHNCALLSNGNTYCWGYGGFGELGNNSNNNYNYLPVLAAQLPTSPDWISANLYRTCALKNNTTYCVGDNDSSVLTTAAVFSTLTVVNRLGIPGSLQKLLLGMSSDQNGNVASNCAISTSGLVCWGNNSYGQIGNGVIGGTVTSPTIVFNW